MRHLFTMWPVALPVQCTPLAAQPGAGTLGHCQPCRLPRRFRVLRSNSKASPQLVRAAPEGFTFPDSAEAAVERAIERMQHMMTASSVLKTRMGQVGRAAAAVATSLERKGRAGRKQAGKSSAKLAVEIPVADDSAAAMVEVAQGLLKGLPSPYDRQTAVVCWGAATAAAAGKALPGVQILNAGGSEGARLSAKNLLFLGLKDSQVPAAKRILAAANGTLALLLRTSPEGKLSAAGENFVESFAVSYSFQPVAIKAFIITQDGVVLKDGPDAAWLILKKDLFGKFKSIGRMSTRPTASDLEAAFVNAAAVDSPVNKGIAFVRSKLPF